MSTHSHRSGRRYFLSDIPLTNALDKFRAALESAGAPDRTEAESIPLAEARGRITAAPVWAVSSSPHYDAAAMDGVAVKSRDTAGATETSPVRLKVPDEARWVDTGDPMPGGFDAVVMVEVVHEVDESTIEVQSPVAPYHDVRPLGEDIVATELVLPESHLLRPVDLGACAAAGHSQVAVRRRPRVSIIPTGSELVPIGSVLKPGDIVEYNSLVLAGLVEEWGAEAVRLPPVADDYAALKVSVRGAIAGSDVVLVNAGSSAGSEDYTARLVQELGELVVHGAAIRPGHPVVLGVVDGKPAMGIPGYPVSAALTCELFVRPLIESMLGRSSPPRARATASMTRNVHSPMGEDEFLRVRLGRVRGRLVAAPIQRGAGVIMSLVRADGIAHIPRLSEGVEAGSSVDVELLRPLEQIDRTIVAVGSHDLVLDLIASRLTASDTGVSLASSNVGSLGGLLTVNRGEAHLAGSHLLDEATGEYNVSFVERYVRDVEVVLVNLVRRDQGLIVPQGNPRGVRGLEDLSRADVTFVSRQRGSGTRVLLDYKLRQVGIDHKQISGYEREEYTHLAVAATVAAGQADVAMGILSAARAMNLDFVPLLSERYDLVISKEVYRGELITPLLELIGSAEFRTEVEALGGYDASAMGEVVAEFGSRRT